MLSSAGGAWEGQGSQQDARVTPRPVRSRAICSSGEVSGCLWGAVPGGLSGRRRPARSVWCNGPFIPAAAREDCISVREGTFAWSPESPPCLHRYTGASPGGPFPLMGRKRTSYVRDGAGSQPGAGGWVSLGWCAARATPRTSPVRESRKTRAPADGGTGHLCLLSGRRQPLLSSLDKMTRESWPGRALAQSARPASLPLALVSTSLSPLAFSSLARSL